MTETYRRVTRWSPAYNKTAEGNGRHGMELRFGVIGPKGAVVFLIFTGFYHSTDRKEAFEHGGTITGVDGRRYPLGSAGMPMAADLGVHAKEAQYENQRPMDHACEFTGGICYYDGSGIAAEAPFAAFTDEGEDAVFDFLERYYEATFNRAEDA